MKNYIIHHDWKIVEEGFVPEHNRISESIFSIGNGKMGQRANFEEKYSGDTLNGTYVAGIYYPDKTRVGWWKNGYPEYFNLKGAGFGHGTGMCQIGAVGMALSGKSYREILDFYFHGAEIKELGE